MRRRVMLLAGATAVVAACSSSGTSVSPASTGPSSSASNAVTTSTTTPPPVTPAARARVAAFFAVRGRVLLEFERVTAVLASGAAPTTAECVALARVTLPRLAPDPNKLQALAQRVPATDLATALHDDIAARRLLLAPCAGGRGPAENPATYAAARGFAERVRVLLARYGILLEPTR